jgi:hypothetical protein
MNLELGWSGVGWIGLAHNRDKWGALVNAVMNLGVPKNAGNFLSDYTTHGLLSSTELHRVRAMLLSRASSSIL